MHNVKYSWHDDQIMLQVHSKKSVRRNFAADFLSNRIMPTDRLKASIKNLSTKFYLRA